MRGGGLFQLLVVVVVVVVVVLTTALAQSNGDSAVVHTNPRQQEALLLNIHLKLDRRTARHMQWTNQEVTKYAPNNEIDLINRCEPHVTLYLTQFRSDELDTINRAVEELMPHLQRCLIDTEDAGVVVGNYGMWDTQRSACLQRLSDRVVNATRWYIVADQPVPQWVLDMPDGPEKEHRIRLVQLYGSPNVFDTFSPHVTLAYDAVPSELESAFRQMHFDPQRWMAKIVALGKTGDHGTVLRGEDFAQHEIAADPGQSLSALMILLVAALGGVIASWGAIWGLALYQKGRVACQVQNTRHVPLTEAEDLAQ